MATNPQIETVNTGTDKAKLAGSVLLLVGGVVAYYALPASTSLWMRVVALISLLLLGVVVFFLSEPGKRLVGFGRESVKEVKKVVWPTRKEALQNTGYVFAFVITMALFLWITDKVLEFGLYDLILGWKR